MSLKAEESSPGGHNFEMVLDTFLDARFVTGHYGEISCFVPNLWKWGLPPLGYTLCRSETRLRGGTVML